MNTAPITCYNCETEFVQEYEKKDMRKGYIMVLCPKCGSSYFIKKITTPNHGSASGSEVNEIGGSS